MRHLYPIASLVCIAVAVASPVSAQTWRVGDKVQYFDSGWWDAVVMEIGTGQYAGYFKMKAEKFSTMQWSAAKNIRAKPGAAAAAPASGPRPGDYSVLSYGNPAYPPIRLGKISLSTAGTYRFYGNGDNLLGQGRYSYAADKVTWMTGILSAQDWAGGFEVSRGGQTHTIRLKRGTIATNSTR